MTLDLKWGNSYDALNHFDDAIAWTSKDEVADSDLPELLLKTTLLNLSEFNTRLFQNALQTHGINGRIGQDILRSLKPYQKEIERLKKREDPIQSTIPIREPQMNKKFTAISLSFETPQLSQGFSLPLDDRFA